MKKILALIALTLAAQAHATTEEQVCLAVARYAKTVAEAREVGRTEQDVVAGIKNQNAAFRAPLIDVISLIYTMQMDQAQARQLVYLKCVGTGFGLPERTK